MKTHISNFGIENFRVFKDHTHFEFAPITILVGPNGSGKSSLMTACSIMKEYFSADLAKLFHDKIGDKKLADRIGVFKDNFSIEGAHEYLNISLVVTPSFLSKPLTANLVLKSEAGVKGQLKVDYIQFKDANEKVAIFVKSDGMTDFSEVRVDLELLLGLYKHEYLQTKAFLNNTKKQIKSFNDDFISPASSRRSYFGAHSNIPMVFQPALADGFAEWKLEENGYCFNFSELQHFASLLGRFAPSSVMSTDLANKGDEIVLRVLGIQKVLVRLGDFGVFRLGSSAKRTRVDLGRFSVIEKVYEFFGFQNDLVESDWGESSQPNFAILDKESGIEFEIFTNSNAQVVVDTVLEKYQVILQQVDRICSSLGFNQNEAVEILSMLVLYRLEFDQYCAKNSISDVDACNLFRLEHLPHTMETNARSFLGYVEEYLQALSDSIRSFSILDNCLIKYEYVDLQRRTSLFENSPAVAGIIEFVDRESESGQTWQKRKLEDVLSFAVDLFKFGKSVKIHTAEGVFSIFLIRGEGTLINVADCGLGIKKVVELVFQLLPQGLKYGGSHPNTGEAVLNLSPRVIHLEEPEANLHPDYQSKLADLIAYIADSFGTQFIIETHSEYLIRKLQFLSAKRKIKSEDTVIYYFYPPDHPDVVSGREPQVKKINILSDGRLSAPFGEGFYDESARLMISLMEVSNPN